MRRATVTVLLLGLPLAGCDNACQSFCETYADFAQECGVDFGDAELQACFDAYADPTPDEAKTCRDYGRPDILRREWTCDDVNLYAELPE